MPRVLQEILESFYSRLGESNAVDDSVIADLRALFDSGKKLKANDIVTVLSRVGRERPS